MEEDKEIRLSLLNKISLNVYYLPYTIKTIIFTIALILLVISFPITLPMIFLFSGLQVNSVRMFLIHLKEILDKKSIEFKEKKKEVEANTERLAIKD